MSLSHVLLPWAASAFTDPWQESVHIAWTETTTNICLCVTPPAGNTVPISSMHAAGF